MNKDVTQEIATEPTKEGLTGASLRSRVLRFVGALIVLSLLGSAISLFQITGVNQSLQVINRVSMPVSKLFAQMQIDAEVFKRELTRGLGYQHWSDPHWQPRPVPKWITEVLENEIARAKTLLADGAANGDRESAQSNQQWGKWVEDLDSGFGKLRANAEALSAALERKDREEAARLYPLWMQAQEEWSKQLQWGVNEHERAMQERFTTAQSQVGQLRTGLEMILLVVVSLSLLLLWLGERALRPLNDLTRLARDITRRGLKREDKEKLPTLVQGDDEVSQLAREFHRMATQLLERERVVESQRRSLEDQNKLLKENLELQDKLQKAENLASVGRLSAQVAHEVRNPLHSIGLEAEIALDLAQKSQSPALRSSIQSILGSVERLERITENYLKLSRLSAGEKADVSLVEVLQHVLATYASTLEKNRVAVDWKTEGTRADGAAGVDALMIRADQALFEQALGNLLQNAVQALAETRSPRVRFMLGRAESGRVWMRIEDNGPGVPREVLAKLFTPFITTKAQGTGLGLSFVKKVIEDHQGEIRYREAAGGGACFECVLPPSPTAASSRPAPSLETGVQG